MESKDRKANAHLILKLMCDSVVLRPHLRELLSAKYALVFVKPIGDDGFFFLKFKLNFHNGPKVKNPWVLHSKAQSCIFKKHVNQ